MFIYRLLPILSSILIAASLWLQIRYPFQYPWIAILGFCTLPLFSYLISRGRVKFLDMGEKMLPSVIFILILIFALLLAEGWMVRWLIIVFGFVVTFLSLELLFFLAYVPSRYPVHGLSRVNMAYVPFIVFFTSATSVGLIIFLHISLWVHVVLMAVLGLVLFRTTGHPEATKEQNRRWMLIGLVLGLHLGFLGVVLPLTMYAQAAIATILFSGILRLRRYLYHPLPSKRQAWLEAAALTLFFVLVLFTSRWL